jgi:hypothetical protein
MSLLPDACYFLSQMPKCMDYFGWCTWDAFCKSMPHIPLVYPFLSSVIVVVQVKVDSYEMRCTTHSDRTFKLFDLNPLQMKFSR